MNKSFNYSSDFKTALELGRPPNIKKLFPNSKALLISGKYIDQAMLLKTKAMTIAANGRNSFIIRGALAAAQRANAAIIIEIARSEGGTGAYCAVNFWNIARLTNDFMNELGITIPVAIHADHFGIKKPEDIEPAKTEIVSLFDAGITSIAIDASHMPDAHNLLANIELSPYIPGWAGLETEVGEIKGKLGLSTDQEALFLIQGLNAHNIFPNWIALNNGTTHGIEASDTGINVELTSQIHRAISKYKVSGAQHGTSGNNSGRLREIASKTRTTKANVATALQMISWGLKVNDYGNAILDNGNFIKQKEKGVTEDLWADMLAYAKTNDLTGGNFKKLNLPFENKFLAQPKKIRDRMARDVEEFVYGLLTRVFNAEDTAQLVVDEILKNKSYDPGFKIERIESKNDWTKEKIMEKALSIPVDKGQKGDFDD
ncbi:MAG: ketose-bisphosphate aldolase [Desulfobacula sp.]|jgi:fructose/tagatose bisphosphate aldolase|uniref:class II fructose-bisphosphate aldolase n=1 Tax=Desulfobacula sp. TaxID=2593537 RepID=UPI001D39B41F|nr:ketose-bisphosphate aldolase [Desulfobacula sp.]MBT3487358.1 ketose-bisphosphate aldolase [Desulfobacula sp.]MBT3806590.1 ketose-bisphosphate aldolase [Desulfobacula sp.]MBT4026914.1 ketose-bisphosphate aldolase [Desulfobacula sp.]MBT4200714.1 ketose-bisphosphate aldolase [Desulfobacula sp.]